VVCEYCAMSPASFADMKVHIENKHPKEPFGEAEAEKYKKKYADAKAETNAKARAKSGQMDKAAHKTKGPKELKTKKGAGCTDALPAELLAAMAGMGPKKKKK
jgi:hypothetical protein